MEENFPTAYHITLQIQNNQKQMIKLSSKGCLPDALENPVEAQINQIPDGLKHFLASYV